MDPDLEFRYRQNDGLAVFIFAVVCLGVLLLASLFGWVAAVIIVALAFGIIEFVRYMRK